MSREGWGYPPDSIILLIFHIPLEEHLFFLLQPIFLVLLHSLISLPSLLPFEIPPIPRHQIHRKSRDDGSCYSTGDKDFGSGLIPEHCRDTERITVQTLRRRPLAASFWAAIWCLGALALNETHDILSSEGILPESLRIGEHWFYLGWILVWITPVIGLLEYLGGRFGKAEWWTVVLGSTWLCVIDT